MIVHLMEAKPIYDVFDVRLTNLLKRYFKYGTKAGRVDKKAKTLLSDAITKAYYDGAKNAGMDPKNFNDEMSQEVDDLIFNQFQYLDNYVKDIKAARKDDSLRPNILDRVKWWYQTVQSAKILGESYYKQNENVRWELGMTEEHCDTCYSLNGGVHPRKWFIERGYIPKMPGAKMDCRGYLCDCRWVPV